MRETLELLTRATVDYAGLFPPAAEEMAAAVSAYAEYLDDPARRMLGRFVVPVMRLREFEAAASGLLPATGEPWRLSALVGPDPAADVELVSRFNSRHGDDANGGRAIVDALELKASSDAEVQSAMSIMPGGVEIYFEVALADADALVPCIARTGGRLKARTGGVIPDAFPTADAVASFMITCRDARVPFKLTAGLHHPMRGVYRLTYAANPPTGAMFGYLNALVAGALAWTGNGRDVVSAALLEQDAESFRFGDDEFVYRGHTVTAAQVADAREHFVTSFGSCSFREPVDELALLNFN